MTYEEIEEEYSRRLAESRAILTRIKKRQERELDRLLAEHVLERHEHFKKYHEPVLRWRRQQEAACQQ